MEKRKIALGMMALGILFVVGGFVSQTVILNPGGGAVLTVEETENPSDGSVIEYQNMTSEQKRVFDEAVSEGDATVPPEVSYDFWTENEYVRYNGTVYRVNASAP
jgi:hypothetical protein